LIQGQNIRHVLITEEVVKGATPGYWEAAQEVTFLEAWVAEERTFQQKKNRTR
jgi:hypothetical protein